VRVRAYVRKEEDELLDHKQTIVTVRTNDFSLLGHETMSLGEYYRVANVRSSFIVRVQQLRWLTNTTFCRFTISGFTLVTDFLFPIISRQTPRCYVQLSLAQPKFFQIALVKHL
jgi:hypothetical protein